MTIGEIITFVLLVLSFAMGRYSGYHDGYVKGRKAVRKYYESLQQVGR
jgi:mannose/fructose/N-acetylgalactosamine-specific phosphotransferase system component IID